MTTLSNFQLRERQVEADRRSALMDHAKHLRHTADELLEFESRLKRSEQSLDERELRLAQAQTELNRRIEAIEKAERRLARRREVLAEREQEVLERQESAPTQEVARTRSDDLYAALGVPPSATEAGSFLNAAELAAATATRVVDGTVVPANSEALAAAIIKAGEARRGQIDVPMPSGLAGEIVRSGMRRRGELAEDLREPQTPQEFLAQQIIAAAEKRRSGAI